MKYVVLLFGIVLVLVGGLSIYSGYGIIEVERGWASVIAGATALTGGVITIALAWILRSLDRLRSALEGAEVRLAQRDAKAAPEPAPSDLPLAPATSPGAAGQQREEPLIGAVGARAETAEIVGLKSEPPAAQPAAVAVAPETAESSARALSRAASAFANAAAKAERRTEPSIGELWRRVGVNLDAERSGKPADGPGAALQPKNIAPNHQAEAHESGSPATEPADWLDEALAGFDASAGPESPETAEEPPPLAPNSPPDRPGPQPEVIGRYEAEGTAYVMYADGSIEAQSEQGIMRFRSMAELQAFFQS